MSSPSIRHVTHHLQQAGRLVLLSSWAGTAALLAQQAAPRITPPRITAPRLASPAVPLVIRDVTVIDVQAGQRLAHQTVAIIGRRIRTITAATARLPTGARVVNGRGKYLIPGLWDMHVHPMHYVDIAHPLLIANGVTGVRDAASAVPLVTLNRWKQEVAAGARVGPRMLVSGPGLDLIFQNPHLIVNTPAEARLVVKLLKSAGADMIKFHSGSPETQLAVAAEARRLGMPFGGHSNAGISGLEFSDSGATFLDHSPYLSPNVCSDSAFDAAPDGCRAAAEHLRRNNTWAALATGTGLHTVIAPELDSLIGLDQETFFARFYPSSFRCYPEARCRGRSVVLDSLRRRPGPLWNPGIDAALRRITPRPHPMIQAGLPIVVGTDMAIMDWGSDPMAAGLFFFQPPGFSVHLALAEFVLAGMTPAQALQTATLNPARALRTTDSLGTIEPGKVADLVLLDADPLESIWNTTKIRAVIANGRYYDRTALDRLLADAEHAAATAPPDTESGTRYGTPPKTSR